MKKLNRSFLKKFNALLIMLLAFLGFSGCQPNEPDDPMYPHPDYGVKMTSFSEKLSVSAETETDITLDFEQHN